MCAFLISFHNKRSSNKIITLPVFDRDILSADVKCFGLSDHLIFVCCTFSRDEVLSMQEFARSKGMEVIPLVQTFGHMEVRWTHVAQF